MVEANEYTHWVFSEWVFSEPENYCKIHADTPMLSL